MIDYKKCFICDNKLSMNNKLINDPINDPRSVYECFDTQEHEYHHETGINYIYTYIGIWINDSCFKLYLDSGYSDIVYLSQNNKHLYRKEDSALKEFELFANILKEKDINKLKKLIMIL